MTATLFDDILQKSRCAARVRLFGFLWRVRCGGPLERRPSALHLTRSYSVCQECGDVTWPPRMPDPQVKMGYIDAKGDRV